MADIIVLSLQIFLIHTSLDAASDALQNELVLVEIGSDRTIEIAVHIFSILLTPKSLAKYD